MPTKVVPIGLSQVVTIPDDETLLPTAHLQGIPISSSLKLFYVLTSKAGKPWLNMYVYYRGRYVKFPGMNNPVTPNGALMMGNKFLAIMKDTDKGWYNHYIAPWIQGGGGLAASLGASIMGSSIIDGAPQ